MSRVFVCGDEEGRVYSPVTNRIYVREHFLSGLYGVTHHVEIPERYRDVIFHPMERVFVVFEGERVIFDGKDFRTHISETNIDPQWQQMMDGLFLINRWKNERGEE